MPRRTDINTILILGAGPITIGQACEFDYSGSQACRALREEGYRVALVNSNPATIMTDPEMADATYIEPLRASVVKEIIRREKPDALLPTMGGQTALNLTMQLDEQGVLNEYGVRLIGASRQAIARAEDRGLFGEAMRRIGLEMPRALLAGSLEEARRVRREIGYPAILRPSYTLGGGGGGVACNNHEFDTLCAKALQASPASQVLIEEPVLGWKEFELEVVRDRRDNCIIVCSIENIDPMGIHTGDSITVAPVQTLTDKEYQQMRNAAIAILREIGVDTGGANVQFAVNPENGRMVVIEMNPRVSRSSSLASKATGFPIARVAAKLAVGYTLDELANEITGGATPASFEPMIDYVVTKLPRFNFEKFAAADTTGLDDRLTTQMKSVGEAMAIGRTFRESLQKALGSLEDGGCGLDEQLQPGDPDAVDRVRAELRVARSHRLWYVADALRLGMSVAEVHALSRIDPWFLNEIHALVRAEETVRTQGWDALDAARLLELKQQGFSDRRLAALLGRTPAELCTLRERHAIHPAYKCVDSCAAEFSTPTAYMYSTYEQESEAACENRPAILILGSGPNRIGQGIEFDYCCVHAALALREESYETIMLNCNPETVSTDYDVSDRLYFEPLTLEHVLAVTRRERPQGVIVQFGGQTPLSLARQLVAHGVPLIGTPPEAIDRAEDREHFKCLLNKLGLRQPDNATTQSLAEARRLARSLGYPLVLRPSYVLGGRAMEIVYNEADLERYFRTALPYMERAPVLLDRFLENAVEVDVDAVSDQRGEVLIGGIMEHVEQAGIHSGDSACCIPPHSLSTAVQERLVYQVRQLAGALGVVGLVNVQFAVQDGEIYVLEVNPRASRSIPYVSKATGVPLARIAARCMVGRTLAEQGYQAGRLGIDHYAVKEAVLPFDRLPGVDILLGPEMKSTGEVMGIGANFGEAFYKAAYAVHARLPHRGRVFISVRDADKPAACRIGAELVDMGFTLCATEGTARALRDHGLQCERVNKVLEGQPHVVDMLTDGAIDFIINTTAGRQAIRDSYSIRRTALQRNVFYATTISGADAAVRALRSSGAGSVLSLQDRFPNRSRSETA